MKKEMFSLKKLVPQLFLTIKYSQISFRGPTVENYHFSAPIRGDKRLKQFKSLLQSLIHEEGTTILGDTNLEVPAIGKNGWKNPCKHIIFNRLYIFKGFQRKINSSIWLYMSKPLLKTAFLTYKSIFYSLISIFYPKSVIKQLICCICCFPMTAIRKLNL